DFDQLKQELSSSIIEGTQERYHLNWPGKREALLTANAPIAKTLRPCREESVDFDTTKNLFIEGDNLDALKLLQETYLGKVKMIYIDPPYNTGNDFIYEDDFAENADEFLLRSNQKDEEGNRLVANTESNGRFHSDWLSMIYPRLKLARNLLRDDGVIFISIDDKEQENLKKLCDEIYSAENYRGTLIWQHSIQPKGSSGTYSVHHNFVYCYAKSDSYVLANLPRTDEHNKNYLNPDNDPNGRWRSGDVRNALYRPNLIYDITTPSGKIIHAPEKGWRWSKETIAQKISTGEIIFSADETRIIRKIYLNTLEGRTPETLLLAKEVGSTRDAANEIKALFDGGQPFDTPKPTKLLGHLLRLSGEMKNDLVLDFFAGSATTAHTVMQLNADDGGNRKFIMVQLPEPCNEQSEAFNAGYSTIAEISKERIRRAGKKILEAECHQNWNKDIGFRVLKTDSSNMAEVYYTPDAVNQSDLFNAVDNIKPDRTPEDLLFQVLLDAGVDLSLPIRKEIIQGYTVFFVDENALVACFDTDVNEELVRELAQFRSYDMPIRKIVFRDNGFASDAVKINVEQIFRQLSPGTEVKSI
ncbi:MAG: site-specific DNA-methyltransferase, partial [Chlorobiaceae bacterium]|nr:site-specific DNA-methyltransferase [Chlorobiaceae bacterium]